jgi:hypothetical protein
VIKLTAFLLAASGCLAQVHPANWTGEYPPCDRHSDLLNHEHIDLRVRISTSNTALARQFARAMDFWTGVLDIEWHVTNSQACSIQLVDGTPELFDAAGGRAFVVARAQFPDRPSFQGWIAFNPALRPTESEMFVVSVHEIGHLFGLSHNPSGSSVMFFLELDESVFLEVADLNRLAGHHKLRAGIFEERGLTAIQVAVPSR